MEGTEIHIGTVTQKITDEWKNPGADEPGIPTAPKDPVKREFFYIMREKEVAGSVQPDGRGTQFIYLNDARLLSSARIVGNVSDEEILTLLKTAGGFRRLVYGIGVTVEAQDPEKKVDFVFQMYGKKDCYASGTTLRMPVRADGTEHIFHLLDCQWSEDDDVPGQIRFEFEKAGELAVVTVRLYLREGFHAPEPEEPARVDLKSPLYRDMLAKSLLQTGNNARLKKAIEKARRGEEVTLAFIGGSITQGAGAVPLHTQCYAYKAFQGFCRLAGRDTEENIHYMKAGVGGTPSELGMLRYERDILRGGKAAPDVAVVEFAVNDEGDETKGECYDSLVRKILGAKNRPAVVLLFAVFDNDWNLQERLSPVGRAYRLPMVSVKDCVVEQFYRKSGEGRVIGKYQFFYDCYHPSNIGHTIMADVLIHLFQTVDAQPCDEDDLKLDDTEPPIGGEFEKVRLLDRRESKLGTRIDCGSFSEVDTLLQAVEMDRNTAPTPQFPYNWFHRDGGEPFVMDITCTALLLVMKDSGSPSAGCAEVCVDGVKVLTADPRLNGWTHCNPVICFRKGERKQRRVEVRMRPGDENKEFTILGFGYVDQE